MKRFSKTIISLASLGMLFSIASCGSSETPMSEFERKTRDIYESGLREGSIKDQTYEEWLNSIKGQDGKDGKDGQNGHTPEVNIGGNGNWFIDGVDTGISAQGPQGEQGETGSQGPQGPQGEQGVPGKDGTSVLNGNGVPSTELGKNGDSYIDLDTWDYYVKENEQWVLKGNIKGEDAEHIHDVFTINFYLYTSLESNKPVDTHKIGELTNVKYLSKISRSSVDNLNIPAGMKIASNKWEIYDKDLNYDGEWSFSTSLVTSNVNLYIFGEYINYSVTFKNDDGSVLYETTARYGQEVVYPYNNPVAQNVEEHYIYTFVGWDKDLLVTGDAVFNAQYQKDYISTTAYFYDYDNTLLATLNLKEGDKPIYPYDNPTRADDVSNQLQFQFDKWTKVNETEDTVTFKASYSSCTLGLDIVDNRIDYYHGESKNVSIPNKWNGVDIIEIGNKAFDGSQIESINIPKGIKTIGEYAFNSCTSLTSITIPDSVTSIGEYAFYNCSSLTSITIPNSVTSIDTYAFSGCTSLTDTYICVSSVEKFISMKGKSVLKGNVHLIDLNGNEITEIAIPNSVTSIGYYAFNGCSSLTSITIPDSVTSIGGSAFFGCTSLTSITIPDSVTSIGDYAFKNCTSLTIFCENMFRPKDWSAGWNSECPVIWGFDGNVYRTGDYEYVLSSGKAIITSVKSDASAISIPATLDGYDVSQFNLNSIRFLTAYKNKTLTSFDVPDSVEAIGSLPSFSDFTVLEHFNIPTNVTSIGSYAFNSCASLTSITIPDNVTSIGSNAFYSCKSLTSITIPDSVTSIGSNAFRNCTSLTSITIPDSVTSIGSLAFDDSSITDTYVVVSSIEKLLSIKGRNYLSGRIHLVDPNKNEITEITIPDSVTSIGSYAFRNCISLTSITIPDSVTSIGSYAFNSCTSLTSITIPDSVTSIGDYAFKNCTSLTIYCEALEEPVSWSYNWNSECPVIWGVNNDNE